MSTRTTSTQTTGGASSNSNSNSNASTSAAAPSRPTITADTASVEQLEIAKERINDLHWRRAWTFADKDIDYLIAFNKTPAHAALKSRLEAHLTASPNAPTGNNSSGGSNTFQFRLGSATRVPDTLKGEFEVPKELTSVEAGKINATYMKVLEERFRFKSVLIEMAGGKHRTAYMPEMPPASGPSGAPRLAQQGPVGQPRAPQSQQQSPAPQGQQRQGKDAATNTSAR
ncbi:uncharacterized protein C8A04DRAFT_25739 [Dichotomopilus funicola]|uniref:Uncharacterized protein n=1 Tax=Dichotomopilus funicola TaxID=1934379 RepID=A0AAN6ZPW4_9PEZI|nr:hypothetical protein C8A04DRAFT_25739 [Dichotomopilus funicola]